MTTDALLSCFCFRYFFGLLVNCFRLGAFFCCMYDIRHTRDAVSSLAFFFPIFIFGRLFRCLSNRFSKERYDFPLNDFIEAEPANTFAEAIGGDTIGKPIEGTRNIVGMNLIVSLFSVRPILQAIHRIGELTQLGVSDCQFDFV